MIVQTTEIGGAESRVSTLQSSALKRYVEEKSMKEFSVCQFFSDGKYEYVRRFVEPEEAVKAAKHYTDSVAAKIGITQRVIITDGGDCCVFEWEYGKGITWPKLAHNANSH